MQARSLGAAMVLVAVACASRSKSECVHPSGTPPSPEAAYELALCAARNANPAMHRDCFSLRPFGYDASTYVMTSSAPFVYELEQKCSPHGLFYEAYSVDERGHVRRLCSPDRIDWKDC